MYSVSRKYQTALTEPVKTSIENDLMPKLKEIPGFVHYFVIEQEKTEEFFVFAVFKEREGAETSNKIASKWKIDNGLNLPAPEITEGKVVLCSTQKEPF